MHTKHFDGFHQPILDYYGMLKHYASSPRSRAVLSQYPPFRYAVVPDIDIRVSLVETDVVVVTLLYPGVQRRKVYFSNERIINALRRLYVAKNAIWAVHTTQFEVVFNRPGYLYLIGKRRADGEFLALWG